jgi:hypothetical protein
MSNRKLLVAVAAALQLACTEAQPQALMSEQQARSKAISVLKGDPYGRTAGEVAKNIKDARLVRDGKTRACGARKRAIWEFHVVVVTKDKDAFKNGVIDGYLALDARTGKMVCANLPLLD